MKLGETVMALVLVLTIAESSEENDVVFLIACDKDLHQDYVEHDSLHQHPHEAHEEEIVKKNGHH